MDAMDYPAIEPLEQPLGPFIGRTVELAGDYLTPPQIAEIISRHTGLPARSHQVPVAQVKASGEDVGQMFEHFNDNPDGPLDIASLRAEHPGLMDLATWLRSVQ